MTTTKPKSRAARAEPVAAPTPDQTPELSVEALGRAPDDSTALPPLWREWLALKDTTSPKDCADPDRFAAEIGNKMLKLEARIIDTPARTLADAYAQMAILDFWHEQGAPTRAKPTRERLSEGVHVALETASSPDPIIDLVRRAREARERYCDESALSDEETKAFDDNVFKPAEDALLAAKPTTREGVAAILDLAIEDMEREAGPLHATLFKNARDAVKGGAI